MTEAATSRDATRARIIDVAARLLHEDGAAAVTTRAVAEGAGVQAPTIYRLFGDKDGLLDAVAEHVLDAFVSSKARVVEAATADGVDALADLRAGWQTQIEFGLANPDLFRILSGPGHLGRSSAVEAGRRVLEARVRRVAQTGRLRVSEERAVQLVHAAGTGAVQTMLAMPPGQRDVGLADDLYEAVVRQILTDAPDRPDGDSLATAVAMRALTARLDMLSGPERDLLSEWLGRVVAVLSERDG